MCLPTFVKTYPPSQKHTFVLPIVTKKMAIKRGSLYLVFLGSFLEVSGYLDLLCIFFLNFKHRLTKGIGTTCGWK